MIFQEVYCHPVPPTVPGKVFCRNFWTDICIIDINFSSFKETSPLIQDGKQVYLTYLKKKNPKGTDHKKLQSTDPPQKVWINAPPEDVPLRSGSTVHMVCFATGGNPKATLAWFKVRMHCRKSMPDCIFVSWCLSSLNTEIYNLSLWFRMERQWLVHCSRPRLIWV